MIEKIDLEEHRISLALKGQSDEGEETSYTEAPAVSSGFGSLGDLLKASQQKKDRKKR
jgi:small subunit ribosomal protein S1